MDRFLVKKRKASERAAETEQSEAAGAGDPVDPAKVARPGPNLNQPAASQPSDAALALLEGLTDASWREALSREFGKAYFTSLAAKVAAQRASHRVFPPPEDVWTTFNLTPLESVRVVILGQDPYHGEHQAHGLCFSVRRGVAVPGSLRNIYKELAADVTGFKPPSHGNLEAWGRQGVLLLNASLTVRAKNANSHADYGWQTFTDAAIKVLNERTEGVVFILWGKFAQNKGKIISRSKHCVLEAAHPSPLSVTKFRGCKVFSKANDYLKKKDKAEVDWTVPA